VSTAAPNSGPREGERAEAQANVEATVVAAEQARQFRDGVPAELADVEKRLTAIRFGNETDPDGLTEEQAVRLIDAFKAKATYAADLVALRQAQVQARRAHLDVLRAHSEAPESVAAAEAQLKEAQAAVDGLRSAEQTSRARWDETVETYKASRLAAASDTKAAR
jgi:hypothetical protein